MRKRPAREDPELRALLRDIRRTERRLGTLASQAEADAALAGDQDLAGVRDALEELESERPKPQGC